MQKTCTYYARNEEERTFDTDVRDIVSKHGTKTETVLYAQNQMILNLLRRIDDELTELKLEY